MTRVAMLAPMTHELDPIVEQIGMTEDGDLHRGTVRDVEVVALLTKIGMTAGGKAAERALELDVDWVMVVGIAGGVDRSIEIGGVVVPEVVLDRRDGRTYRPHRIGDIEPRGIVSTGDDLVCDPPTLERWGSEGVVAVEMESGAVAAVCWLTRSWQIRRSHSTPKPRRFSPRCARRPRRRGRCSAASATSPPTVSSTRRSSP